MWTTIVIILTTFACTATAAWFLFDHMYWKQRVENDSLIQTVKSSWISRLEQAALMDAATKEIDRLREENESLRQQLEAKTKE